MSEMNKKLEENEAEDEELSALLDSAVKDFQTAGKEEKKEPAKKPETLWTEDFLKSTQSRFEQNLQSLFSPGPDGQISLDQIGENMQRIAETATQAAGFDTSPDNEFSSIIAQTLKNLTENTENIQNQISEEDLMNVIGSLGNFSDSDSDPGELLPLMEQMMQSLLKKEILYPVLSQIIDKYPQWLNENKSKITEAEYKSHEEQLQLMKLVCEELDKERTDDSDDVQKSRFDKVLGLMQKLQDCGQPPAELVGELPFDGKLPDPRQCSLM